MKRIPITKGLFALVDDDDFEKLSRFKWKATRSKNDKTCYVARTVWAGNGKYAVERMHRIVIGAEHGQIVDHVNGDTLDNRRGNLRICSNAQNQMNASARVNSKSGLKGVTWNQGRRRWVARVRLNGKVEYLGSFSDKTDAARAYNSRATEAFGEFSRPNRI